MFLCLKVINELVKGQLGRGRWETEMGRVLYEFRNGMKQGGDINYHLPS